MDISNPCITCGACCTSFRVSFYWAEADDAPGGTVPAQLTCQISPFNRAMQGTDQPQPRCIALDGQVGDHVSCRIYPKRPSTCREFSAWLEDGTPNLRCTKVRLAWGLKPLPVISSL